MIGVGVSLPLFIRQHKKEGKYKLITFTYNSLIVQIHYDCVKSNKLAEASLCRG